MKNRTILASIVLVLVVAVGFMFIQGKSTTGNVVSDNSQVISGEMQKVVLSEENLKYNDVIVDAGKPITLSADSSVKGCARSVVFELNGKTYSKYLVTPSDSLTLPALEKGTYTFACAMRMVPGTLIVK